MKKYIVKGSSGFLFLVLALNACKSPQEVKEEIKPTNTGINTSFMDQSVKPSDDFFRFVTGKWIDNTEIPSDRTRWGSFDELRKNTDDDVMAILKEALADKSIDVNSDQGKALSLYKSILDTVSRNRMGVEPLKPYLAKIDAIQSAKDLVALITAMEKEGGVGFFGSYVYTDAKDSNKNVVYVGTGSLGLPDRDYYVSEETDMKEKRAKYVAHVSRMLQFLGDNETSAKASAEKVLALETKMATATLDRVARRDRRNTYNPMKVSDLQKLVPDVDWNSYFEANGMGKLDSIVVSQPKYMEEFEAILKQGDVASWKAYLRWTLLNENAGLLSTEIADANWEFFGKTLTGAIKQRPAEERALATVNGRLGEALGKLYVAKKFPPEAKAKAQAMIANVMKANNLGEAYGADLHKRYHQVKNIYRRRID